MITPAGLETVIALPAEQTIRAAIVVCRAIIRILSTTPIVVGGRIGMTALVAPSTGKSNYCFSTSAAPFSDWHRLLEREAIMGRGPAWEVWWDLPGWFSGLNVPW